MTKIKINVSETLKKRKTWVFDPPPLHPHLQRISALPITRVRYPITLRYDLIDRPGVLENDVPVNYHSLYDLSVLVEGFCLSPEHPKVCIICGAVETASSTQKRWNISCPEYT